MKLLVATLAVLLGLAVAADLFVKDLAEDRAAEQIARTMSLDEPPEVDLGGFPFILKAVSGNFGEIRVVSEDVHVEGVALDRVEVVMRDVEVSLSKILADRADSVRIGGGEGTAVMSERALARALRRQGVDVSVTLGGDGTVLIEDPRLPAPAEGTVGLDGRRLVISATDAPAEYAIDLPRLIRGLTYRSITIEESSLTLDFSLISGIFRAPR